MRWCEDYSVQKHLRQLKDFEKLSYELQMVSMSLVEEALREEKKSHA